MRIAQPDMLSLIRALTERFLLFETNFWPELLSASARFHTGWCKWCLIISDPMTLLRRKTKSACGSDFALW